MPGAHRSTFIVAELRSSWLQQRGQPAHYLKCFCFIFRASMNTNQTHAPTNNLWRKLLSGCQTATFAPVSGAAFVGVFAPACH